MRKLIPFLLFLLLVTGCASQPPRPVPFRSPVTAPRRVAYLPLVTAPTVKLGVAGCPPSCASLGCAWCYSWCAWPGTLSGVETVPMIWDETHVYDPVAASRWLLGFNECDLTGQCNLTPAQAVKPWAQLETRFPDRRLVAPVPSHLNPDWLPQFRAAFLAQMGRPPRFAALAAHCYWPTANQCRALVERFKGWAAAWGVPEIWVTEFHFSREAEARAFAAYLEAEPMVTRYAPFLSYTNCDEPQNWDCAASGNPSLFTPGGALTVKGRWYARPTPEPIP